MIEIYAGSLKGKGSLSSNMYTKAGLKDIFGEEDAAKLLEGIRIQDEELFWQLASAFNKDE